MSIGPGSLKCVVSSGALHLEEALRAHVPPDDARALHEGAVLVYTEASTEIVRDWLKPHLGDDDSVLVLEFERWSSYGAAIDRDWLLRRGH